MDQMNIDIHIDNLVKEELPVALETVGMDRHAASMRIVVAHAEAVELLQTVLIEAEQILDPDQYKLVEEFIFWAQAAISSAATKNERDFQYSLRKFHDSVRDWWVTLIMH